LKIELRRFDVARLGGVVEHGRGAIIYEPEQIGWVVPVERTVARRRWGGIVLRFSAAGALDLGGSFDAGCRITRHGCGSMGSLGLLGRGDKRELHDGGPAVEQADGLGH
jgi:hypothetical protein